MPAADLPPALHAATAAFHAASTTTHPDGGLCLVAAAYTGYAAHAAGYPATICHGTYQGQPHWWVQAGGWVLDPTAHQFVPGAGAAPVYAPDGYVAEAEWPNGYTTMEYVHAEAARAYPAAAAAFVAALPTPGAW